MSCNGPTGSITPFYLGNDSISASYQRSNNWGIQLGLSIPLDGSITEMCKQTVKRKLEKERLDYELVRAIRCAELLKTGYTIRPDSPLSVMCDHVVSIEAWRRTRPDDPSVLPLLPATSLSPSSSQVSTPLPVDEKLTLPQSTPQKPPQLSSPPQSSPQQKVQEN